MEKVTDSREVPFVGLIVNPIAGIGGTVGLKGTDGVEILEEALRRGGRHVAPERSIRAINVLRQNLQRFNVITCRGEMGEAETTAAGVPYELLRIPIGETTTAADTQASAKDLEKKVSLILFAGGDGTARDISEAVDRRVAVLGIPCGVKNYSAVFASSPEAAGQVAASFILGEIKTIDSEVLDFDENSIRKGRIKTRVCGMLRVPSARRFMQNAKSVTTGLDEAIEQEAIAKYIVEDMNPIFQYVLGPGSTTWKIAERLGLEKTLLGVDVIFGGRVIANDVSSMDLEKIVNKRSTKLIITPIGGQGYVLGRGNQQLTPAAIRAVGKENITVICTRTKLASLPERRLLVDIDDTQLSSEMRGYWRVVVGYREFAIVKVE